MRTAHTSIAVDVDEIHRAFGLFVEPDGVVELRAPGVDGRNNRTASGYFDDAGALVRAAGQLSGRAPGCYVTLNAIDPALLARAANRLEEYARTTTARYEGTLPVARKTAVEASRVRRAVKGPAQLVRAARQLLKEEYVLRYKTPKGDHHVPGVLLPTLYARLLNPRLARKVHAYLRDKYVTEEELATMDYAFFPLATEPENTLLVFSRAFLNQIEVVRNVAYNLPAGMVLVVKEHPAALGKRQVSYYRKLLEIPNVRMADPALEARRLITRAKLVSNIAGSVGLEALILGKPVLAFGQTPYELLPDTMMRRAGALGELGETIDGLLRDHHHDEAALTSYIAAVMRRSVSLDFYTNLLGRVGYGVGGQERSDEVQALARYTLETHRLVSGKAEASTPATGVLEGMAP